MASEGETAGIDKPKDATEEEKEAEDAEEAISGPLCFYCTKCRTIVGDSFSFLTSNEEAQTITLSASSNIQRSADVYTSKSGFDVGSTYFNFTCTNCQELLGRYYLTTSKDLDELREKFTFLVNKIESYELGKAQHGKMPEPAPDDGLTAGNSVDVETGNEEGEKGVKEAINVLQKDVLKVQHVLVGVLERVEKVESMLVSQPDPNWGSNPSRKRKG